MRDRTAPISPGEAPAEEVARLRGCLSDLVSIMTLPALRAGGEPPRILGTLLDALREMLRLAFVLVRLNDPDGGPSVEMMRVGPPLAGIARARELGAVIDTSLGADPSGWPPRPRVVTGSVELAVASARLGLQGESAQHPRAGRLAVAVRRCRSRQPPAVGVLRPDVGGAEAMEDERHGSPLARRAGKYRRVVWNEH